MGSSKRYRPWLPKQSFLLPPSPSDWLPKNHLVHFMLDVIDVLDLGSIEAEIQSKDPRGTSPYDPRMMVALLVYGYCTGIRSSRRLERATYEDIGVRVLTGGQHPDHSVIADFRRRHHEALRGLFVQTALLAQRAGMVSLGHVSLDGSKVQANASKHKAMSYERMQRKLVELEAEIAEMLEQVERSDQEEDARHGPGKTGEGLPDELSFREARLKKIREAKQALEAEAAAARADELKERADRHRDNAANASNRTDKKRSSTLAAKCQTQADQLAAKSQVHPDEMGARSEDEEPPTPGGPGSGDLPHHRPPTTPAGEPGPKAQRNFTDPDSRIMKKGGEYLQGYNCQAVVDEDHQIIGACDVTNQPPDCEHLPPLMDQLEQTMSAAPDKASADNGYWSDANAAYCEQHGIDAYIATGRDKHGTKPIASEANVDEGADAKARMRSKVQTEVGRSIYGRRKAIVEPVFGQIKEARGIRRFLLRGIELVRSEWALICAGHNLLKLFRVWRVLPS